MQVIEQSNTKSMFRISEESEPESESEEEKAPQPQPKPLIRRHTALDQ